MNQGQFNELMGELRGIATKLDRLIDGQTQQQTVSGAGEKMVSMFTEKMLADFRMERMTAEDIVDDPAGAFREAEAERAAVLTPDKPKARDRAADKPLGLRNGPGESMDISRSIQDQAERKHGSKKAKVSK